MGKMKDTGIEALLDKYKKGETTATENELIENWLLNPDSSQSHWNQMDEQNQDQWLGSVLNRIDQAIDNKESKVVRLHPGKHWWKSIAAAAAILIVCFSLFLGWPSLKGIMTEDKLISLKTPVKATKQITLSDGSKVWVNAGSELKYAQQFTGKVREVYLTGEAYFDIKHDSKRPFIVHTGKIVTTVLGTAFNIKTDGLLHQIVVTVTRGKVSVSEGDKLIGTLTPNQQITYNTVNLVHEQNDINALKVTAWLQNDLYFEDITFDDAVKELEQRFKVQINFNNDNSRNCRFTGTLLEGKNLEQILKVICAFNNSTYKKQENGHITIYGNGCE
jgi:transmembrane sensor